MNLIIIMLASLNFAWVYVKIFFELSESLRRMCMMLARVQHLVLSL